MSAATTPSASSPAAAPASAGGRRIAIVSLPGEPAGEAVSAFVAQLGLSAIAVPGPAGAGEGTYMDRVARLSDLGFAVVVLPAGMAAAASAIELEIGFLLGVLGRTRVCFVVKGDAALLPDLDGASRHTMDDAALWHLLLAREMKRAGVEIDLNRII